MTSENLDQFAEEQEKRPPVQLYGYSFFGYQPLPPKEDSLARESAEEYWKEFVKESSYTIDKDGWAHQTSEHGHSQYGHVWVAAMRIDDNEVASLVPLSLDKDNPGAVIMSLPAGKPSRIAFAAGAPGAEGIAFAFLRSGGYSGLPLATMGEENTTYECGYPLRGIGPWNESETAWAQQTGIEDDFTKGGDSIITSHVTLISAKSVVNESGDVSNHPLVVVPDVLEDLIQEQEERDVSFQLLIYGSPKREDLKLPEWLKVVMSATREGADLKVGWSQATQDGHAINPEKVPIGHTLLGSFNIIPRQVS